jgi:hypothetical protein
MHDELRCTCKELSVDQQRIQALEAEAELRRLRDRVRKAIARWSTGVGLGSPPDAPVKRSRLQRPIGQIEPQLLEVQWNVTSEELVEHLCFWRHSSALACVNLTDCLKELTPRSEEPPASKRALTLVWWGMEQKLEEAAKDWRIRQEETAAHIRRVVPVCIGDIVPLFIWEVDLLRSRPETRLLCREMLDCELMKYQKMSGTADHFTLRYLTDNPLYTTSYGVQACRCEGYMRNEANTQRFKELREKQLEERAAAAAGRVNLPAAGGRCDAAPSSPLRIATALPGTVAVDIAERHREKRRRLDESLVTLADAPDSSLANESDVDSMQG